MVILVHGGQVSILGYEIIYLVLVKVLHLFFLIASPPASQPRLFSGQKKIPFSYILRGKQSKTERVKVCKKIKNFLTHRSITATTLGKISNLLSSE